MKIRLADYIFKTLADLGTKKVFFVSGGGAMFLNDALGKEKRIQYICNLHEQACAMAAEGYARINGKPGVINVTTGPGGTNAITGVVGAWLDSIPMIIISGQVKFKNTVESCKELKLRQLGDQELNIIDIVKPITKFSKMLTNPLEIKQIIYKMWNECQNGRPGPVWLDVPMDLQSCMIETNELYDVQETEQSYDNEFDINLVIKKINESKCPAIIAGNGVRLSNSIKKLLKFSKDFKIPVLTSISGIDLIQSNDKLFFGRPGILGERAANFIMQNCDLLLVLGTRMGLRIIGHDYNNVAKNACKIMVDIDDAELNKPFFIPDIKIHTNISYFFKKINDNYKNIKINNRKNWLNYCNMLKTKYKVVTDEHYNIKKYVSSYVFADVIGKKCKDNTVIVTGNGTAYTSTYQAIPIKNTIRVIANQGCASMGWGLPAAIGASFANIKNETLCITGDGSIQMNIQELQTIKNYNLPIKIFVFNNEGYLSIKLTQTAFFNKHFVGSEKNSGIILPDLKKIAKSYGFKYFKIKNNNDLIKNINKILEYKNYAIIEVMTDPFEKLGPKAASRQLENGTIVSAPIDDLAPFLSREEYENNKFKNEENK